MDYLEKAISNSLGREDKDSLIYKAMANLLALLLQKEQQEEKTEEEKLSEEVGESIFSDSENKVFPLSPYAS